MANRVSRALALLLLCAGVAHAQMYTRFGPANGILKGSALTPQTTAAAASDVTALFSGTCDAAHALFGDGSCKAVVTGTVPTGVLKGASGALAAAAATDITALLNPTAHGVLFGEGTAALTSLTMAADTLLQGQGVTADPAAVAVPNCGSATTALNYSTTTHAFGCQTVVGSGGAPGGSNTDIQYNSSGGFGGASNFTYTPSTGDVVIATPTSGVPLIVNGGNSVTTPIAQFNSSNSADLETQTSTAGDFAQITVRDSAGFGGGFCISNAANICESSLGADALDIFSGGGDINIRPNGTFDYKGHQLYISGRWTSSAGACALASGSGWSASGGPGGGTCTLPFAVAFGLTPTCTVTAESGNTSITTFINSISTTQVTVEAVNLSGVGQNDTMDVVCVGTL